MTSQICIIIAIIAYLGGMIYIGITFSKKNTQASEFYLGGRKLGPLVTAMSAEASDMSSYLLMGLPGLAYLSGLAEVGWTAIGLAVGTYLNWLFVSKRIRRYSSRIGSFTIPEFFAGRYGDDRHILTCIAALIIVIFFVPYTASGFAACGKLFSTLFGMNYIAAMLLSAAVIVLYCTLGGFLAVSTTDLIQGITMSIALLIVVGFGAVVTGGFGSVMNAVEQLPGYLSLVQTYSPQTGAASPYTPLMIASMLAWGLGYFGMPHILLRFMAIEDENKLTLSRRIATVWVVISMSIAVLIGVVGYSLSQAGIIPVLEGSNAETVIIQIASTLSAEGIVPALIAGGNHVYRRLPASGCRIQHFPESGTGFRQKEAGYKSFPADRKTHSNCHFPDRRIYRAGSQQLHFRHRLLCLGRLRRRLRPCGASGAILEAFQQAGRACRHDCRRRHGICMEIRHCQTGRRFRHL